VEYRHLQAAATVAIVCIRVEPSQVEFEAMVRYVRVLVALPLALCT
jgi:hypothetical protein